MTITVITVSDRASRGEYEDKSGPAVLEVLRDRLPEAALHHGVVSDAPEEVRGALEAGLEGDVIITTGGTGISPRDTVPEVTAAFIERELPGIPELLRSKSYEETELAVLSRGRAGVRGTTLVVNVPGSTRGAAFCTQLLVPLFEHALSMLRGEGH